MPKQSKITFDILKLEDMRQAMGDTYRARVGVLGGRTNRTDGDKSGMTNAEIGLIHEFGSVSRNIPPRSFLRMPLETHMRELVKAVSGTMATAAFEVGDYKGVFKILGAAGDGISKESFATSGYGTWAANAPMTVALKGSDMPLIDTGQLRRAITSDVVGKGNA